MWEVWKNNLSYFVIFDIFWKLTLKVCNNVFKGTVSQSTCRKYWGHKGRGGRLPLRLRFHPKWIKMLYNRSSTASPTHWERKIIQFVVGSCFKPSENVQIRFSIFFRYKFWLKTLIQTVLQIMLNPWERALSQQYYIITFNFHNWYFILQYMRIKKKLYTCFVVTLRTKKTNWALSGTALSYKVLLYSCNKASQAKVYKIYFGISSI